jgi:hypothetical protein
VVEWDDESVISRTTSSAATPSPPSPAEDMSARRGWFGYGRRFSRDDKSTFCVLH